MSEQNKEDVKLSEQAGEEIKAAENKPEYKFIFTMVAAAGLFIFAFLFYGQLFMSRQPEPAPDASIGRIQADQPERGTHLDLLFSEHVGAGYQFFGQHVNLYIAYYERDELVLRELVGGIGTGSPHQQSGSLIWGLTMEENRRSELRARIHTHGAVGHGYFDFSRINLDFEQGGMISGPDIIRSSSRIEVGSRHILQMWQTGNPAWHVGSDPFSSDVLSGSEQTVILYLTFE